jgi:lysophospholipase L1-like esterase
MSDARSRFKVTLDGSQRPSLVGAGPQTYPIADGLGDGPHDLVLHRQSEASAGVTQFLGLALDPGGRMLAAPAPKRRRIEWIGDSISCGYGDVGSAYVCGVAGGCHFSLDTEDHDQSFGALTARALGAELTSISWSGIGVQHNCCGADGSTSDTMLRRYPEAIPGVAWSFSGARPDAVVIALGTNDFTGGDPGHVFVDRYRELVGLVRGHSPDAYVLLLSSPMLAGAAHAQLEAYLSEVVALGDSAISMLSIPTQGAMTGCDCHPTVATHQSMANLVTAELRQRLGW